MSRGGNIVEQAIAWHLRLSAASEQEWLDFTAWLEADRAHADAYDRILEDDILAAPMLDLQAEAAASVVRAEDRRISWRRRGSWIVGVGGALAASLAAIVLVPAKQANVTGSPSIITAMGEKREMTLADGSRVELNGGSELVISSPRSVTLKRGQAVFHVRHDAAKPFEVAVNDIVLRDIGTVFDVACEGGRLGVQVAEGAVMYQPDGEGLTLRGGMALSTRAGDERIVVRRIAAESVGGWRKGRLAFRQAPLREVAAEIRRTTGEKLTIAPALADVPFTGSVRLAGNGAEDIPHLAGLTGLRARRSSDGWILTSVRDEPD